VTKSVKYRAKTNISEMLIILSTILFAVSSLIYRLCAEASTTAVDALKTKYQQVVVTVSYLFCTEQKCTIPITVGTFWNCIVFIHLEAVMTKWLWTGD